MNVVITSPIDNSLYSRLILELCRREVGINVTGIVVRRILNLKRVRLEWKRDGARLLRKVWEKLLLGNAEAPVPKSIMTPQKQAEELELTHATVSQMAKAYGIPLLWAKDLNTPEVIRFDHSTEPDMVVYSGGGLIRKELLSAAGMGVLNLHQGLLPEYRGMDVVEWPVLMEGLKGLDQIGLTLHFMDHGVDTGPLLVSEKFAIEDDDTFARIRLRMAGTMPNMMLGCLRSLRDGALKPISQERRDGRQYFVCHPRIATLAHHKLSAGLAKRRGQN